VDHLELVFAATVGDVIHRCHVVAPPMVRQRGDCIVNLADDSARVG
jgi:hypothetical protein